MPSTAILIGNANYRNDPILPCCLEDVAAMQALVDATGRYDLIRTLTDLDGDGLRDAIREALPETGSQDEVFFYFSGHGAQVGSDFYYCGIGFDAHRPNETGMSHTQLHELLRAAEPKLLVKVIDACYSGTLLVKTERLPVPIHKEGFRHVLQFSSSLDDQTSLAGEPLSAFTRAFLEASVRKTDGVVFYSDVSNSLRDDFIGNDEQIPFFVSQGTGREILVDDATKLAPLRKAIEERWSGKPQGTGELVVDGEATVAISPPMPISLKDRLVAAEARMAGPTEAKGLIDALFDGVLARFRSGDFGEFFDLGVIAHPDFSEETAEEFIIRVLAREARPDRLVTAEIVREKRKQPPWMSGFRTALMQFNADQIENYTLSLNCTLERAQLRLTLTPKYRTLQQMVLVLSCAPSLENCYIFEITTQHPRSNWDTFDKEGREIVRRWYKLAWDERVDGIVEKVSSALEKAVRDHLDETTLRLEKE